MSEPSTQVSDRAFVAMPYVWALFWALVGCGALAANDWSGNGTLAIVAGGTFGHAAVVALGWTAVIVFMGISRRRNRSRGQWSNSPSAYKYEWSRKERS